MKRRSRTEIQRDCEHGAALPRGQGSPGLGVVFLHRDARGEHVPRGESDDVVDLRVGQKVLNLNGEW